MGRHRLGARTAHHTHRTRAHCALSAALGAIGLRRWRAPPSAGLPVAVAGSGDGEGVSAAVNGETRPWQRWPRVRTYGVAAGRGGGQCPLSRCNRLFLPLAVRLRGARGAPHAVRGCRVRPSRAAQNPRRRSGCWQGLPRCWLKRVAAL